MKLFQDVGFDDEGTFCMSPPGGFVTAGWRESRIVVDFPTPASRLSVRPQSSFAPAIPRKPLSSKKA